MNKLDQIKVKQQAGQMRKTSEQSVTFLNSLDRLLDRHAVKLNKQQRKDFDTVIQHNKNMSKFFGIMEQQK